MLLLAAACGGSDSAAPTTTATSTPASSTASSSPAASVPECPPPPMPADAADVSTTSGDLDGDDAADTATVYRIGPKSAPEWHLAVDLASGARADSIVPRDLGGAQGIGNAAVAGAVDVNGDGTDELWASVGSGSTGTLAALFVVDGCGVEAATADGTALVFSVGGASGSFAGVGCTDVDGDGALDFVVQRQATSSDGGATYQTTETEYVLVDGMFGVISQVPGTASPSDPDFARLSSFRCGPVQLPT